MSVTEAVRILGRGPGRSRSLTLPEAEAAMAEVLRGEAAPEALGAMLMLLRMKGETAEEIAGLTRAVRASLAPWQVGADIDWPSYAAGRSRGAPLFLLSAKLLAQAGVKVFLHGWNSHQNPVASVRGALEPLGITSCDSAEAAKAALAADGIAYTPLNALSPQLWDLIRLRDVLGLRSCMNTVARMMNPSAAPASLQGVFHPGYRVLQQDAAVILGDPSVAVIKGGGGEFERHPGKLATMFTVTDGTPDIVEIAPEEHLHRRLHDVEQVIDLKSFWSGHQSDEFAQDVVVATAALALLRSGRASDPDAAHHIASALWADRHRKQAA